MSVREHRLLPVSGKVITITNIREIAQILWNEYKLEKNAPNLYVGVSFSVKCSDRSFFESENISLFDDDSIILKKRVVNVSMTFQKGKEKSIKVTLEHGFRVVDKDRINESEVEIGGVDAFWVSGITDKINLIVDSIDNQDNYYLRNERKISWIFYLISCYALTSLFIYYNRENKEFDLAPSVVFSSVRAFIGAAIIFGMLGVPGIFIQKIALTERARNLWPVVEFDFGPENFKVEKRKRNFAMLALTIIILPILLSIVSNILTALLVS